MTFIYALLDPHTKEIRYVDKTVKLRQRYAEHCCNNKPGHRQSWIKSMGCAPEMIVLEEVDDCWADAEQWWISYFRFLGARLTNLTIGGEGTPGYSLPISARQKIAIANSRRIISEETRAKIALAGTGRRHSEETKAKIGAVHRGKVVSEETKLKLRARRVSEEAKEKLRNRVISEETRLKMSIAAKNRKRTTKQEKK